MLCPLLALLGEASVTFPLTSGRILCLLLVVWMWNVPVCSRVWTWSPDGGAILDAVEAVGSRSWQEEVGHRRWALRFYSSSQLPVHSLLLQILCNQPVCLPKCIPCNDRLYFLLSKARFFSQRFCYRNKKISECITWSLSALIICSQCAMHGLLSSRENRCHIHNWFNLGDCNLGLWIVLV